MSDAYKKLYEAQKVEHEKTWAMLREQKTINTALRATLVETQRQLDASIKTVHDFMQEFAKKHPYGGVNG